MVNNNPMLYRMNRYKFINLFNMEQQQLSANLRELTQCLPLLGVGYLDGVDIKEFDRFENMEDAFEHIERLAALPDLPDIEDFPEECTFDTPNTSTESAKKKLRFDVSGATDTTNPSPKTVTATTSDKSVNANNTNNANQDVHNTNDANQDIRYIPNRDIYNLSMDKEEDEDTTEPPSTETTTSTTPPPEATLTQQDNFPLNDENSLNSQRHSTTELPEHEPSAPTPQAQESTDDDSNNSSADESTDNADDTD